MIKHVRGGIAFESELKTLLISNGLDVWSFAINERADLVLMNRKDRILELKLVHVENGDVGQYYFSKNIKQHNDLMSIQKMCPYLSIYYAVKWQFPKRHVIKFYPISQYYDDVKITSAQGYSFQQFVEHCKRSDMTINV